MIIKCDEDEAFKKIQYYFLCSRNDAINYYVVFFGYGWYVFTSFQFFRSELNFKNGINSSKMLLLLKPTKEEFSPETFYELVHNLS